jgi:parallel beta helix pectate lyase-like protein
VKTLSYVVILLLSFAVPVRAAVVYSGCDVPPTTPRHVWYIDPVHGKTPATGGNGSQAAPWNSLNGVVSGSWATAGFSVAGYTRPLLSTVPYYHITSAGRVVVADQIGAPPVQPGDTILLMSGNYGDISIGSYLREVANPSFVTVQAAPGQTPVLSTLYIYSTTNWVFNGLKVQSLLTSANTRSLVLIRDQGASFPTSNIVFENMVLSSQDNAETWTQAQWIANARNGFFARSAAGAPDTKCISFTGSHISNVRTGASLAASQLLFSNNQIDHFGDDGIDYAASNLAITRNDIHDNLDVGDGNHEDAMQGQIGFLAPGATVNYFQNILIDSNLIVRQTDPELSFPTYLQGIDAFDSDWTNVTVTNNVIVTSSCYGIDLSSLHNSLIANNTILEDGLVSTPGCAAGLDVGGKSHEGPDSSNVRVTKNLADHFAFANDIPVGSWDHNVALTSYQPFVHYANGAVVYAVKPGVDAYGNVSAAAPGFAYASQFQAWNPAALSFNLMLKAGSVAIGAGAAGAPTVDILGVTRAAPYTVGAYAYPY